MCIRDRLWAAGARSNNMLQAAMPDDWRLPGFCTVRTIPVEDIQPVSYTHLGCGNDAYFLFYDEDARVVSGALHTKVLHADVPPLGEVCLLYTSRCV